MDVKSSRRYRWILLAALVVYLGALLAWVLPERHPVVAGLFHDDGVYMGLAESLAERGVYRDNHTPEPIQVAKYPPGVPLLILAARGLGGDLEGTLRALRVLYALFLGLGLVAFHGLARRVTGPWTAAMLALAAALAPSLLDYLRIPMSEVPYLGLTLATLLLAARFGDRRERPWRHALVLGGLCTLVFALRSVGAMTPLAVGLTLLWRGRRATAWRLALVGLPPMLALQLFMSAMGRPAAGFEDISVYGLPYSRIMAAGLDWLPTIVLHNLVQSLFFLLHLTLPGVPLGLLREGTPWLVLWLPALVVAALVGIGLRRRRSRNPGESGLEAWHLHLLLSVLLVIPWPFQTSRFLVPLIPLLLLALTLGVQRLGGPRAGLVGAILLALVPAVDLLNRPGQTVRSYSVEGRQINLEPLFAMGHRMRRTLPPDAVVASTMDPLFAAHFGLRGVWGWTIANQVVDLYGGPRSLASFTLADDRAPWLQAEKVRAHRFFDRPDGAPATGIPAPWVVREMEKDRERVLAEYRRLGVTHAVLLLEGGQDLYDLLLARLVRDLAGRGMARPLLRGGPVQVWRLDLR